MRPQGDILYQAAGHYGIYRPGGSFDLRHRWATNIYIYIYIYNIIWIANVQLVYVELAQARPNNKCIFFDLMFNYMETFDAMEKRQSIQVMKVASDLLIVKMTQKNVTNETKERTEHHRI